VVIAFVIAPLSLHAETVIRVSPEAIVIDGPDATQQILVYVEAARDRTRTATFEAIDTSIVRVDSKGLVFPRRDGETQVVVRSDGSERRIPVTVRGVDSPAPASFEFDIVPILTKASCNTSGCHGKIGGQNGFQLSLFGFDAAADHEAIVKAARGRRVSGASPEHSLFLRKATAEIPHGGGEKIARDGPFYRRIARWMSSGSPYRNESVTPAIRIEVEPGEIVLTPKGAQQLRVTAVHEDGRRRCVTIEAEYRSNNETIAAVDADGYVRAGEVAGEAAILVRYAGLVTVSRVTVPRRMEDPFVRPPERNFIDKLVWDKLEKLGIRPSELADDATFLRRAYVDVIGRLPTPDEARVFLASTDEAKRDRLVESLLSRPEYAEYQALRWADILRVDKDKITSQGAVAMTRWLKRQFRENTPYDEFVERIVTARGSTLAEGPAAFFHVLDNPEKLGRSVSQLFLGVRIECAQCHQHPFETWGQEDYFAFAGFFSGVGRKNLPTGGQAILARAGADLEHPRSGRPVPTAALGSTAAAFEAGQDRRAVLASWMTSRENPFFARSIVNRLWAHYFGRGLVEPIDDLRATNPATNEALFEALVEHLYEVDFDLKKFTRTLLASRVYQLSTVPNETNELDEQNFSRARFKALPAEVLLDAISDATGVPEEFNGWPTGARAVELWDNHVPSYFLRIFGRPQRVSVCECERGNEPSVAQALHLMNAPEVAEKIEHPRGRARRLATSGAGPQEIIEELYLATHSRFPSREEREIFRDAFDGREVDTKTGAEDVLWTLLNMKEFIYNH